ncbi:hypothetical protein [Archaeoglobus neptunius]|uniref:hypothetical protein n=1 Tax=Archaeoglobus neptunius TaxID=2798580 RepID=UPI00192765FC|nr:hypothetical protein [Archaeoglobus neptunius]
MLRRIVSEEAPIMVLSFLNFYVALAISIVIPIYEITKEKQKPLALLKIPVLISLSIVAAHAYGKINFLELSTRDLVGALIIIFWIHLYLIQRLRKTNWESVL